MKNKLANFEKNLEYTFKDKNLLIKALTHTSGSQENNEVLEFLGDSVLNLIVTELLLEKFPNENEGFLSLMRSKLVSRKILNKLANGFKLEDFLILGESFKNQEIPEDLLGNALEAILGSIFLENGLLLRPLGNTIYLMPPYCIKEETLYNCYEKIIEILS